MGRSVTGMYSLITEFGVYPVHWDWKGSPVGSKYEMVELIEDNFVRRTDASIPTFEFIQFYLHVYAFIITTFMCIIQDQELVLYLTSWIEREQYCYKMSHN